MGGSAKLEGPDLAAGVSIEALGKAGGDGQLLGHSGGEAVLVVKRGEAIFAVGATCTHYSGPLAEGRIEGDRVICPWHHACFDLRTGAATSPAWNPIACFKVERSGDRLVIREKQPVPAAAPASGPASVLVIGGGAAGHATVETLRREGYRGPITMLSSDESAPYDRPNASKDYLAGNAPEEWMPLRPAEWYAEHEVALRLGVRAEKLDPKARTVVLAGGERLGWDALVLATGATANRLSVPGAELPHVFSLRTLADSRAIIRAAAGKKSAVVVGASFIGLEAAAALRSRGLAVHVVAPSGPLERVLGPEVGRFVRELHEAHGVVFRIGVLQSLTAASVAVSGGAPIAADLVVAGVGVQPDVALAEAAGLTVDRGVVVNEYLETSVGGIWAAGDIARWPEARTGRSLRVEHWVVAQRQGETVARNLLGKRQKFAAVPFFWSQHYDVAINYVGHADKWDSITISGSLADRRATVAYRAGGKILAVATVGRDDVSLAAEAALGRGDAAALEEIVQR